MGSGNCWQEIEMYQTRCEAIQLFSQFNFIIWYCVNMIGSSGHKTKEKSPEIKHIKKSSFVSEIESHRKERIAKISSNRRQMSHSTLLHLTEDKKKLNFHKTSFKKDTTDHLMDTEDQLKRARSLKSMVFQKPKVETVQKNSAHQLNENMIKLKMEQICFKFKTKIGSLLKELNASAQQINRFGSLQRIEDFLSFLAQKVRQQLVESQLSEADLHKARSKEICAREEYEIELDSLKKKLLDKESNEKTLKSKLRDLNSHSQLLLDRINLKQKEFSTKVTEIYQSKISLKESEQTIQNMQHRIQLLEEQTGEYRNQLEYGSKSVITINLNLKEENQKLKEKISDLEEEVQQLNTKNKTLNDMISQANTELMRWRQRFQDVDFAEQESCEQSSENNQFVEVVVVPTDELKKSTMSMNSFNLDKTDRNSLPRVSLTTLEIQNLKLSSKVAQLQKQNKLLSKDILNYATIKERYQKNLATTISQGSSLNVGLNMQRMEYLRERSVDLYQIQLEAHYKKKVQEVAKEWKAKLYQIVHRYEDEMETLKQKFDNLTCEHTQLQKKTINLAKDKYELENRMIEQDRKIYELDRRNASMLSKVKAEQRGSLQVIPVSEDKISERTGTDVFQGYTNKIIQEKSEGEGND